MIRLNSVNKFFNKGKQNEIHVINDVSLELPEKGIVAIFGRSGCGKTTLLNVIGGLDHFHSGSITVEGSDIRKGTDVIRNKYIGYIFQNYNLNKNANCYDNVADALRLLGMPESEEMDTRVNAALKNVGMDKYKKRLPDTLSGGQQQRIAIARAIVKNPKIILADEPTGNLDEANTVMVMDLLKKISKDHLVILVTHEAKLVDYYCDTVIELSDGKVVNVRTNASAKGYAAKDKNAIYLGEFERTDSTSDIVSVEYYGEHPEEPIKIRVVNRDGKLLIKIDSSDVSIIDESSETKLIEGIYEEREDANSVSSEIDMSELPPIEGTSHGKLFNFRSSVKSGYDYNFGGEGGKKKGKKALKRVMFLFAAVLVLMTSIFGTSIGDIVNARNQYNHNVFYVYTPDSAVSSIINDSYKAGSNGIDSIYLSYGIPSHHRTIRFSLSGFETFDTYNYNAMFESSAVYLDSTLTKDMPLICGKKLDLMENEVILTSAVADELLEKSPLGYITEYKDLIGLVASDYNDWNARFRVCGIVESDEKATYVSPMALAEKRMSDTTIFVSSSSKYSVPVSSGNTVFVVKSHAVDVQRPEIGEVVLINGVSLKVSEIVETHSSYYNWMQVAHPEIADFNNYMFKSFDKLNPDISEESPDYYDKRFEYIENNYFDLREDYYSFLDEFIAHTLLDRGYSFDSWLYLQKGIDEAKYFFIDGDHEYYSALKFKEKNGRYPYYQKEMGTYEQYDPSSHVYSLYNSYEKEWQNSDFFENNFVPDHSFIVSDEDYIKASKAIGLTSAYAYSQGYASAYTPIEVPIVHNGEKVTVKNVIDYTVDYYYTVIHSVSPEETENWVREKFSGMEIDEVYITPIISPDDIFDEIMFEYMESVIAGIVSMIVIIVVMSICMYFIMRSSLMSRIKEIGVYRAIGVSRKNLIFKFVIESLVLATLTVFIGFVVMSAFIFYCLGSASIFETIFYYPVWMAVGLLALIYALCVFCGTLPITLLLRKSPSEILSKYDI